MVPPRSRTRRPAADQFAADFLRFCERAGSLGLFYTCYPAFAPDGDGRHQSPGGPALRQFRKRPGKPRL